MKEHFVLKNIGIKMRLKDLHRAFLNSVHSDISVQEFNRKLKDIGIVSYLSSGVAKINICAEVLRKIAETNHWLHELDDVDNDDEEYENGVEKEDKSIPMVLRSHYESEVQKLKDEIKSLKNNNKNKYQYIFDDLDKIFKGEKKESKGFPFNLTDDRNNIDVSVENVKKWFQESKKYDANAVMNAFNEIGYKF